MIQNERRQSGAGSNHAANAGGGGGVSRGGRDALRGMTYDQQLAATDPFAGPPGLPGAVRPPQLTDSPDEIMAELEEEAAERRDLSSKQLRRATAKNKDNRPSVDFVRNMQRRLGVGEAELSTDGLFGETTTELIFEFQLDWGVGGKIPGYLDAATRAKMEELWPELQITMIGDHTEERVLVPAEADPASRYAIYRGFIEQTGGYFDESPNQMNILGIRGVEVEARGAGVELRQSSSAGDWWWARFYETSDDHFDGGQLDDVIISVWLDENGEPQVRERVGTVDPNLFWSEEGGKDKTPKEGTAHIADGQYVYKQGHHRTTHHAEAIWEATGGEQHDPVLDNTGGRKSQKYAALEPVSLAVVRDFYGEDDHHLTDEELEASRQQIRERNDRYTDGDDISSNIHSSPSGAASSLACINIPIDGGYVDFMKEIQDSGDEQMLFTLVDASKLEVGTYL